MVVFALKTSDARSRACSCLSLPLYDSLWRLTNVVGELMAKSAKFCGEIASCLNKAP